jgi:hypothetical protein
MISTPCTPFKNGGILWTTLLLILRPAYVRSNLATYLNYDYEAYILTPHIRLNEAA